MERKTCALQFYTTINNRNGEPNGVVKSLEIIVTPRSIQTTVQQGDDRRVGEGEKIQLVRPINDFSSGSCDVLSGSILQPRDYCHDAFIVSR